MRPVFAVMNNAALDNGVQSLCESMYKSLWHMCLEVELMGPMIKQCLAFLHS